MLSSETITAAMERVTARRRARVERRWCRRGAEDLDGALVAMIGAQADLLRQGHCEAVERWMYEERLAELQADLRALRATGRLDAAAHARVVVADRIQAAHDGRRRLSPTTPLVTARTRSQTRGRRDRRPAGGRPRARRTGASRSSGPSGDSGPSGSDEPAPGGHHVATREGH